MILADCEAVQPLPEVPITVYVPDDEGVMQLLVEDVFHTSDGFPDTLTHICAGDPLHVESGAVMVSTGEGKIVML